MSNSRLSDHDLLSAFEACTLEDFRHADHVRVAWIYLAKLPVLEASRRMAESVRRFAEGKGATEKYHETITQAWMRLVAAEMERNAATDFETFAPTHPELFDSHLIDKFYSRELLATPAARTEFVPPDLSPLP